MVLLIFKQTTPANGTPAPNPLCEKEGLNPYPGDCTLFLQCVYYDETGWLIYTMKCPEGTVFNPSVGVCDHSNTVEECNTR